MPHVVDILHGDALLGGVARDGGGVLAPVLVLWKDLHLDNLLAIVAAVTWWGGNVVLLPSID